MSSLEDHFPQPSRHGMIRIKCFSIGQLVSRYLIGMPGSVKGCAAVLSHILMHGNHTGCPVVEHVLHANVSIFG